MGITLGTSLTLFPKDAQGQVAPSARDADNIYLMWALSNDLPSKSLTLTFPAARLYVIDLIRADGTVAWSSDKPETKPDYTVVVPPDPTQPFRIPLASYPDEVPKQIPLIPLADQCARLGIPANEDLSVRFTVPVTQGPFITSLRLWR